MDVTIITLEVKEKLEDAQSIEDVEKIEYMLRRHISNLCEEAKEKFKQ